MSETLFSGLFKGLRLPCCLALLLTSAGLLSAVPITYTFMGSGTGTLGATSFTGANFTVTLTSDTVNVGFVPTLGATGILGLPAQINIAGIGSETFSGTVFLFTFGTSVGFGEANGGYPGAPGNLIEISDPSVDLYDLMSNFSVTGTNQNLSQFAGADTSGGPLSFSIMSPVTFDAMQGVDLPEPGTWALLGSGLVAVGWMRRRKA